MASTLLFMVIFAIDFIAFVLALAAEQMRSTAKVVTDIDENYSYCVYSSDIATKLGITAFVLLLASQVFTMGASSYFRKGMNYGGIRNSAVVLAIISWITFFIAEACLLGGSIQNAQRTKYRTIFVNDGPNCQTLREGVFEAGAAFILITSIVSKMSYVGCFNSEGGLESGSYELGTYTSLNSGIHFKLNTGCGESSHRKRDFFTWDPMEAFEVQLDNELAWLHYNHGRYNIDPDLHQGNSTLVSNSISSLLDQVPYRPLR
ncbi:unnamed protein product [Dovyalis caffra]|uniref:Uncharacterized protein n=1 Tax=Dovyalis caffra TaxID=77055 RepID=A0AAV1R0Q9_9ROSI|nr:unnamed protein product [Dovyalis caffra]